MSNHHASETSGPATGILFEREKWEDEKAFRREELALKKADQRRLDQELDLKLRESKRSRWWNPLVIAIIAAALAGVGNAVVALLNGNSQQRVEEQKAESERILAAIKTNDPASAATNLKFLVDAGLIKQTQTAEYISKLVKEGKPEQLPVLPAAVDSIVSDLESENTVARRAARRMLGQQGAAAIPAITDLLAKNRNHATANYRQVLGAVEALAEMNVTDRCAAYKKDPQLRRDVDNHADIKEATLTAAAAKAVLCPS